MKKVLTRFNRLSLTNSEICSSYYLSDLKIFIFSISICIFISPVRAEPPMAGYFNKIAQANESKPDFIISSLGLTKNMSIADIGSGGGYFTFRFAEIVEGTVYAVDVNRAFLKYIEEQARIKKLNNIVTLFSSDDNSGLKEKSVDLIFIRNVYHHLPSPSVYLTDLKSALKNKGRLVIIENTLESSVGKSGHGTDAGEIRKTALSAGYLLVKEYKDLPEQSYQIFQVK